MPTPELATLLVSCPDRRGIVAALAQVLYGHGANILDSDQHTDGVAGMFFQRLRFDLSELQTDRLTLERAIAEVAERFGMSYRLAYAAKPKRLALFVSRYDHCLYDLLLRHRSGELACEMALIVSNHPDLERVAREFGVRFELFPITPETKTEQERREVELLLAEAIDLVVLARYMQIVGAELVNRFEGRLLNIHHSFLPAFVGADPYRRARERGVKIIGATAHYVTEELDAGPIIEQDVAHVSHRETVDSLTRIGGDIERLVLARAVKAHLEDRVLVYENRTVVF